MRDLTQKANEMNKVVSGTEQTNNTATAKLPQAEQKNELQNAKTKVARILNPITAEQRIKNSEIFTKLAEKFQFLRQKKDHLVSFMASRDGLKEKLYIVSDNEQNFEISNSRIIEKILEVCDNELDELLQKSETEVSTFII